MFVHRKIELPSAETALPDRPRAILPTQNHLVLDVPLLPPYPQACEQALFGMGCFWGAERLFWQLPGVYVTSVGYAGGYTANPSYEDVCSGKTGHTEVVSVVYEPEKIGFGDLLKLFWEAHDPTQGMRQGNDIGTQYRSAIYCTSSQQLTRAKNSLERYQDSLGRAGYGAVTTEIASDVPYYFAEDYHQQYLARNPGGYCGLAGTGVACPGSQG